MPSTLILACVFHFIKIEIRLVSLEYSLEGNNISREFTFSSSLFGLISGVCCMLVPCPESYLCTYLTSPHFLFFPGRFEGHGEGFM